MKNGSHYWEAARLTRLPFTLTHTHLKRRNFILKHSNLTHVLVLAESADRIHFQTSHFDPQFTAWNPLSHFIWISLMKTRQTQSKQITAESKRSQSLLVHSYNSIVPFRIGHSYVLDHRSNNAERDYFGAYALLHIFFRKNACTQQYFVFTCI